MMQDSSIPGVVRWAIRMREREQQWWKRNGSPRKLRLRHKWRGPAARFLEESELRAGDVGVPLLLLPSATEALGVEGIGDVELSEESITGLVQTTLHVELVSLPDESSDENVNEEGGTDEEDEEHKWQDEDALDILGSAMISTAALVLSPQPEHFLSANLLDGTGSVSRDGDALVDLYLAVDQGFLDFVVGGVLLRIDGVDLCCLPPAFLPAVPHLPPAALPNDTWIVAVSDDKHQGSIEDDGMRNDNSSPEDGPDHDSSTISSAAEATRQHFIAASGEVYQRSLPNRVAEAIASAADELEMQRMGDRIPLLADVSTIVGAQTFALPPGRFVFADVNTGEDVGRYCARRSVRRELQPYTVLEGVAREAGDDDSQILQSGEENGSTAAMLTTAKAVVGKTRTLLSSTPSGSSDESDAVLGDLSKHAAKAVKMATAACRGSADPKARPTCEWRVRFGRGVDEVYDDEYEAYGDWREFRRQSGDQLRDEASSEVNTGREYDENRKEYDSSCVWVCEASRRRLKQTIRDSLGQECNVASLQEHPTGVVGEALCFELTLPAVEEVGETSKSSTQVSSPFAADTPLSVAAAVPLWPVLGENADPFLAPEPNSPLSPVTPKPKRPQVTIAVESSMSVTKEREEESEETWPSIPTSGSLPSGKRIGGGFFERYLSRFSLAGRIVLGSSNDGGDGEETVKEKKRKEEEEEEKGLAAEVGEVKVEDDETLEGKKGLRRFPNAAILQVTLSMSAPLALPAPPVPLSMQTKPAPLSKKEKRKKKNAQGTSSSTAAGKASRQSSRQSGNRPYSSSSGKAAGMFGEAALLAELGREQRWPGSSILTSGFPLPKSRGPIAVTDALSASAVSLSSSQPPASTKHFNLEGSYHKQNRDKCQDWAMADPRVARLLPFRLIETPSSQLFKHSPEDDLERELASFANTMADKIRAQFQLDDRVWQHGAGGGRGVHHMAAPTPIAPYDHDDNDDEDNRCGALISGIGAATSGIDLPRGVSGAVVGESLGMPSDGGVGPVVAKALEARREKNIMRGTTATEDASELSSDDDISMTPSEELREGEAAMLYRMNKDGTYHALAEKLRAPIAKFVQSKLGLLPKEAHGNAAADRYVSECYRLTQAVMTKCLNRLFRGAELYQDQSTHQREAAEAVKVLEADLERLRLLAMDAEASGRFSEAETRLRLRVKLCEAAADSGRPKEVPSRDEFLAGVAVERPADAPLLGNLAAAALCRARYDIATFLLRARNASDRTGSEIQQQHAGVGVAVARGGCGVIADYRSLGFALQQKLRLETADVLATRAVTHANAAAEALEDGMLDNLSVGASQYSSSSTAGTSDTVDPADVLGLTEILDLEKRFVKPRNGHEDAAAGSAGAISQFAKDSQDKPIANGLEREATDPTEAATAAAVVESVDALGLHIAELRQLCCLVVGFEQGAPAIANNRLPLRLRLEALLLLGAALLEHDIERSDKSVEWCQTVASASFRHIPQTMPPYSPQSPPTLAQYLTAHPLMAVARASNAVRFASMNSRYDEIRRSGSVRASGDQSVEKRSATQRHRRMRNKGLQMPHPSKLEAEYQAAEVAKIAEAETLILAAVGSDPDDDVIDNGVGRRRCWSQVVLEYALRVTILQATDNDGARHLARPNDVGDGYTVEEVEDSVGAASIMLLVVMAVCLVATEEDGVGVSGGGVCFGVGEQDPNRGLSAFDAALVKHLVGPSGSPVEALGRSERGGGAIGGALQQSTETTGLLNGANEPKIGDKSDACGSSPLRYSYGKTATARVLVKLAASKRSKDTLNAAAKERLAEDDEIAVLLSAVTWFASQRLPQAAAVAMWMAKQASDRSKAKAARLSERIKKRNQKLSDKLNGVVSTGDDSKDDMDEEYEEEVDDGDNKEEGDISNDVEAQVARRRAHLSADLAKGLQEQAKMSQRMPRQLRLLSKLAAARVALCKIPPLDPLAVAAAAARRAGDHEAEAAAGAVAAAATVDAAVQQLALAEKFLDEARTVLEEKCVKKSARVGGGGGGLFSKSKVTEEAAPLVSLDLSLMEADLAWLTRLYDVHIEAAESSSSSKSVRPPNASNNQPGSNEFASDRLERLTRAVRGRYASYLKLAYSKAAQPPLKVFLRLGSSTAELGDLRDAVDIYRQGAKAWPNCAAAWKGCGLALLKIAAEEFRPENVQKAALLGYVANEKGGGGSTRMNVVLRQAEEALRLANSADHSDALVWASLALCNLRTMIAENDTDDGHYRMAVATAAVKSALRLGLNDVEVMYELATCYASCDRFREAIPLLRRAYELRVRLALQPLALAVEGSGHGGTSHLPSEGTLANSLADALRCRGLDLEALEVYQTVLERSVASKELQTAPIRGVTDILTLKAKTKPLPGKGNKATAGDERRVTQLSKPASAFLGQTAGKAATLLHRSGVLQRLKTRATLAKATVVVGDMNRAAAGIELLLLKLGRTSELKQLQYTINLINEWLQSLSKLTRMGMH